MSPAHTGRDAVRLLMVVAAVLPTCRRRTPGRDAVRLLMVVAALLPACHRRSPVHGAEQPPAANTRAAPPSRGDPAPRPALAPRRLGSIEVTGLEHVDETAVRRILGLRDGDGYSARKLAAARRRLMDLGVFAAVRIQEGPPSNDGRVPLTVEVVEGSRHALRVGAGGVLDSVSASAVARFAWHDRNFLGGLRSLHVSAAPSLILYPIFDRDAKVHALPAGNVNIRFEQPVLDEKTTLEVGSTYSVSPVLYPEYRRGDNLIGFHAIGASGGGRRRTSDVVTLRFDYDWTAYLPFAYRGVRADGLAPLHISSPAFVAAIDGRDDPIDPRSGVYFRGAVDVAGPLLGDVLDLRLRPEVRAYVSAGHKWTFAVRGNVGLVFPRFCNGAERKGCYGDSLGETEPDVSDPRVVRDQEVLLLRGLFSGGAASNRGYPARAISPYAVLGFLAPEGSPCRAADPPEICWRPTGGLTLWELSVETRWRIAEPAALVLFCDLSDVNRALGELWRGYVHPSFGTGVRYLTPVGAVALDVGFRVPGPKVPPEDGGTLSTFYGVPMAVHFGVGQGF